MKNLIIILSFTLLCICTGCQNQNIVKESFDVAALQYSEMAASLPSQNVWPHSVKNGELQTTDIHWWTVGFFPGSLWYIYEYTRDEKFKTLATSWTESLEENQFDTSNHDIGFEMFCSYGNGLRLTGRTEYNQVLINSANSLCARYSPKVGCILSWNPRMGRNGVDYWAFPVIMDNMMNLELLFEVSKMTGDTKYYNIAVSHANKTMINHIRPDYSTYHVVDYNPENGEPAHRQTMQGLADNSTWSRGQAWGIYGFTMCYRYTQDSRYLETACNLADFTLNHPNMPADGVPVWDYDAPISDPRDASAASLMASAFLELAKYCDKTKEERYYKAADHILKTLSSKNYIAEVGTNHNFILKHSTGNKPAGKEIDVPLNYADYYFLEALLRYKNYSQESVLNE